MKNNNNKLLFFIILILLIANTVFSSVLWFRSNHHPRPVPPPPRGQILIDELQPVGEQKELIQSLMSEHFDKLDALKDKEHKAKSVFFSLLLKDTVSVAAILNYAEHASNISLEIDTMVFNHFNKLRSLCNPEQKEKLDRVIQRILINSDDIPNVGGPEEKDAFQEQTKSENNVGNHSKEPADHFKNERLDDHPHNHHRMPPPPRHEDRHHDKHPEEFPDGPPQMPPPGME
jgi:hypothetical protein